MNGLLWLLAGGLLLGDASRHERSAAELYQEMTRALDRAKTFQARFRIETTDQEPAGVLEGRILREKGNRLRLELPPQKDGGTREWRMISDGVTVGFGSPGNMSSQECPSRLGTALTTILASSGYKGFITALLSGNITDEKIDGELGEGMVTDLRIEGRERVEGRWTHRLTMSVGPLTGTEDGSTKVTVWVDTRTHLPLRRRYAFDKSDGDLIETYSDFKFDEPIPSSRFDPKQ